MTLHYDDSNYMQLVRQAETENGLPQVMPRVSVYGGTLAQKMGLVPMEDYPDNIIDEADWKEVILHCREKQMFAEFHQHASWAPVGYRWNQNGLPYCWAWSLAATCMDQEALAGKVPVLLAPNTLGWLVNWKSNGYYLDAAIEGASSRGIAPASFIPNLLSRDSSSFKEGWQDAALLHRPKEWWDTQRSSGVKSMISQCLTILMTGSSIYAAWNRLSHAMSICGMDWDESVKYGIVWIVRNSHDETDQIKMTGDTAIPDEGYGVRAMNPEE